MEFSKEAPFTPAKSTGICVCVSEIAFYTHTWMKRACSGWLSWCSSGHCSSALTVSLWQSCPAEDTFDTALTRWVCRACSGGCGRELAVHGLTCPRATPRTQLRQTLYHQCQIFAGILPYCQLLLLAQLKMNLSSPEVWRPQQRVLGQIINIIIHLLSTQ